jgi:hypothetical protein
MKHTNTKMKGYAGLGVLQAFIGLGAVGGGFALVKDPSGGALGIPLDWLVGSPFSDYLIPGIFLLTVNGIGSLMGAVLSFTRRQVAKEVAIALGIILVAWIVIQIFIIRSFHWLHLLYFLLGTLEFGMGLYIRRQFKSSGSYNSH